MFRPAAAPHGVGGVFSVILIGITMEKVIVRNLEVGTVCSWGMQC